MALHTMIQGISRYAVIVPYRSWLKIIGSKARPSLWVAHVERMGERVRPMTERECADLFELHRGRGLEEFLVLVPGLGTIWSPSGERNIRNLSPRDAWLFVDQTRNVPIYGPDLLLWSTSYAVDSGSVKE